MKGHIEFITTPTSDTPGTAVELIFQDKRYFFGRMHEGLQRAGLQRGAKFLKIKDFFLTGRTEWAAKGGMLGMILSMADGTASAAAAKAAMLEQRVARAKEREEEEEALIRNGKRTPKRSNGPALNKFEQENVDPTLRFRSGPNLMHTLAAARSFIFRQGMPIDVQEFDGDHAITDGESERKPDFEDEKIMIWALPVKPGDHRNSDDILPPSSARKRSLDDYIEGQTVLNGDNRKLTNNASEEKSISAFVVREMFQSQWRTDKLLQMPLHEVKLPATIFVRDPKTKKISKYTGPLPNDSEDVPNIMVLVREPWPGALIDRLPPTTPSDISMSYIVKSRKQRGKFKPQEAKKLGVKKGHHFSELASGNSVQAEDGTTVTPDMVLEPPREGGGFVVIDIPSPQYLSEFLSKSEVGYEALMAGINTFIWLLGPGVSQDEMFLSFIEKDKTIQHVVSSPDTCSNAIALTSAGAQFFRHHVIDPARFPSLQSSSLSPPQTLNDHISGATAPYLVARQGLKLQVIPELLVDERSGVPEILETQALDQLSKGVLASSDTIQAQILEEQVQSELRDQNLASPDAEITCLGTGSMMPSLYRNVSATLLRVPGSGSYLLDCGEDTLGQLQRVYSRLELREIFEDLKVIWISHLHADHHLGTISVIRAWYETVHGKDNDKDRRPQSLESRTEQVRVLLSGRRLLVVSNSHMAKFLDEYSSVEDFGYHHIISLKTSETPNATPHRFPLTWNATDVGFDCAESPELKFAMKEASGLSNLAYCRVSHCWGAYAVSLTFPNGFKFSYSGDCRPSKKFAKIGKGSTVLLHEATFDDELRGEAVAKRHSTSSEAIGVASDMGARRLLLTHFSQRYAKLPNLDDLDKTALKLDTAEDVSESEPERPDAPVDIPPDETSDNVLPKRPSKTRTRSVSMSDQSTATDESQRIVSSASPSSDLKIGIAFDYMRVKVKDIMLLEKFNPVMRELYKEKEIQASPLMKPLPLQDTPPKNAKVDLELDPIEDLHAGERQRMAAG